MVINAILPEKWFAMNIPACGVLLFFLLVSALCAEDQKLTPTGDDMINLNPSTQDNLGIYRMDPEVYIEAMKMGVKVLNLPNYGTFFVYWIPNGFERARERRIMVTLHDENGSAYHQLMRLAETAKQEKCGIVSIQWGWPENLPKKLDQKQMPAVKQTCQYLTPQRTYEIMGIALNFLAFHHKATKTESTLFGFGKAASQCLDYAYLDKHTGSDFFKLFIAVSGAIEPGQAGIAEWKSTDSKSTPIQGKHFYLWCAKQDGELCTKMAESKKMIESVGGIVHTFREDPESRDGFFQKRKYQDEVAILWRHICNLPEGGRQ